MSSTSLSTTGNRKYENLNQTISMSIAAVPNEYKDCCAGVIEYLYIGDRKAAKSLHLLEQLGITHIVNVTPPKQQGGVHNCFESDERFSYLRLPVVDSDVEDISPYFRAGVEFIHQARKQGHSVLVHCQQGVSRSAAIVIAYLLFCNRDDNTTMDLKSAYTLLKTIRPNVKPKSNFLKQLITFDQQNKLEKKQKEQKEQATKNTPHKETSQPTNGTQENNHEHNDNPTTAGTVRKITPNKRPLEDRDDSMINEHNQLTKNALQRKYTSHYFSSTKDNGCMNDYDFEPEGKDENINAISRNDVRHEHDDGIHAIADA